MCLMYDKKIEEYRTNGDEIIFTRDTHGEDYLSTPEGKKLPVVHCVKKYSRLADCRWT